MRAMRGTDRRPTGPRALAVLVIVGTALTVCSCTEGAGPPTRSVDPGGSSSPPEVLPPGSEGSPTSPSGAAPSAEPGGEGPPGSSMETPQPSGAAGSPAPGIATSVDASLRALAGEQDAVTRDQVRSAIERGFLDAGAAPEALEVSIDRTPTGLDVDAIQGAGLIGGECVVGEIREGTVSVTVLPALGSGLCFIGDQR